MIILIGNQKGGCGKTTIATNMAAVLAGQGKDVILFDADRQESSSGWMAERSKYQSNKPTVYSGMGYDDISKAITDASKRYEVVIVDAAGRDSNESRSGAVVADILLIPVKPSQIDLMVLPNMQELIKRSRFINDKLKAFAFVNIAPTHSKNQEIEQSKEVIRGCPEITLLNTVIHDRKCFRDAFSDGLGVTELSSKTESDVASRMEVEQLMAEIVNGY